MSGGQKAPESQTPRGMVMVSPDEPVGTFMKAALHLHKEGKGALDASCAVITSEGTYYMHIHMCVAPVPPDQQHKVH